MVIGAPPAQGERLRCGLELEHLDGDAEVDEQVVLGTRVGDEGERDDGAAGGVGRRVCLPPPRPLRAGRSRRGTSGLHLHALEHDPRRAGRVHVGVELGVNGRTLGERAERGVDEVLAEVIRREVLESAPRRTSCG